MKFKHLGKLGCRIAESLLNAVDAGLSKRLDSFFEELQLASALHPKFILTWLNRLNEESPRARLLKKIIVARNYKKLVQLNAESAAKKTRAWQKYPERIFIRH